MTQSKIQNREISQQLLQREKPILSPGIQNISILAQMALEKGEGAILQDVEGNRIIDFFAGVGVASVGHGHPHLAKMISEQASRFMATSFCSSSRVEYLEALAEILPEKTRRVQLYSSGAEAVEAALRLARCYTKKYEVISFWGGFHGKTAGVLPLMGSNFKHQLGPQGIGCHIMPNADCSQCPFKLEYPDCGLLCAQFVEDAIKRQTFGSLAAIIVEPIQGTEGNIVPPDGYLPALAEIARRHDMVFILDEMITGFGRTGKMFGHQHFDVTPDIMTLGKGMGAGFPVTGLVSSEDIVNAKPFSNPSFSSSSYGGNPLACAAGKGVLDIIQKQDLVANSKTMGDRILSSLKEMKNRFPFIGRIQGKGLMIGVDLVEDQQTGKLASSKKCQWLFKQTIKRGLLTMNYTPRWRINPPLVINESQVDRGLEIIEEVFDSFKLKFF